MSLHLSKKSTNQNKKSHFKLNKVETFCNKEILTK